MANSTIVQSDNFHVRSISMPSRSHPIICNIEEDLHKLKTSSTTMDNAANDLQGLGDLYRCINEFLHLPSILQAFSISNEKKWVEKELEVSVRLLDLCGAVKDNLVTVDEHVQELLCSLRRRGDSASEELLLPQVCSRKVTRNNIKKCQKQLKHVERMCASCPSNDMSCDLSAVARVLIEGRALTISLLDRILLFLSVPTQKSKAGRWSFISKALNSRRVACDGENEDSANSNYCFKDMEVGLESLFRRLIQNRVSLLNILSDL